MNSLLVMALIGCGGNQAPTEPAKPRIVDEIVSVGPIQFGGTIPGDIARSPTSMPFLKEAYLDASPEWTLMDIAPTGVMYVAPDDVFAVAMVMFDELDMDLLADELKDQYGAPELHGNNRVWTGTTTQVIWLPKDPLLGSGVVIGQVEAMKKMGFSPP